MLTFGQIGYFIVAGCAESRSPRTAWCHYSTACLYNEFGQIQIHTLQTLYEPISSLCVFCWKINRWCYGANVFLTKSSFSRQLTPFNHLDCCSGSVSFQHVGISSIHVNLRLYQYCYRDYIWCVVNWCWRMETMQFLWFIFNVNDSRKCFDYVSEIWQTRELLW